MHLLLLFAKEHLERSASASCPWLPPGCREKALCVEALAAQLAGIHFSRWGISQLHRDAARDSTSPVPFDGLSGSGGGLSLLLESSCSL